MRVGAPVVVNIPPAPDGRPRSMFHGMRGVVVSDRPVCMVQLDGERRPLLFGETELVPASDRSHWVAGE